MYYKLVNKETGKRIEILNITSIKLLMHAFIVKENEQHLLPFLSYSNKVLKTVFAMYGLDVIRSVYSEI